ncbi:MAG: hypothetical protein K2J10_00940, partial [Muribaculaceae bacterium]|nr:hypothetical protein [Muribaculaceae bacterium]
MLPFYMKDGNWLPAYNYDNNASTGSQINPKKIDDTWLCSMVKVSTPIESDLGNITDRITNFSTNPTLDIQPFEYRNCFYGYITTYGGKKVNIRFRCSFLKYDRNQG